MPPVAEGHIIRQLVHPHPRDLLVSAIESGQLLDRWAIFLNYLMACHAIGGSGEAHGVARIRILMAIVANKTQSNMLLVTVRNGLLRPLELRGKDPTK
jgi:hypothetical protein